MSQKIMYLLYTSSVVAATFQFRCSEECIGTALEGRSELIRQFIFDPSFPSMH